MKIPWSRELVEFGPCTSAESVKACALIGLHMMAEETSLGLGDMCRYGCPKSPGWSSGGFDWAGSEGTYSFEDYEHNVDNLALEVVGQKLSGEVVSLFLEDWELVPVALSWHVAMDLLCQEMRDACWVSSKVAELTSFAVFTVPEPLSCGIVAAKGPFSGCDL